MFIKSYNEIFDILNRIVKYKSNVDLEEIIITWMENENSIELVLLPVYKYVGYTITGKHPMVVIASFPKIRDNECVIEESVTNCCSYGKCIYYKFRKDFPLKRDLGRYSVAGKSK